jgi:CubicO group peptidase (beta-lactamase class C family)
MSLAIVENGRVIYAKGFGTTSLTTQSPPTADTQYRLASVTKTFTAVAVLQLVQAQKVKLDEPARQYCAELSALNGAPTVRHFLMHQSGMRHTTDLEDKTIKGPVRRIGDALASVAREPLQFAPGTKTHYTSWGYAALGCVIETASGQSYSDFLKERIFEPAGLARTTFDHPGYNSSQFSSGFRRGILWGLRPSEVVDTRFKVSASGLISTASDLVRFARALFDRKLVSESLMTQMFYAPPSEGPLVFTPGWVFQGKQPYGLAFDNNGGMEGTTALMDVVPDRRYALALLANRERYASQLQPIVTEGRRLLLDPSRH